MEVGRIHPAVVRSGMKVRREMVGNGSKVVHDFVVGEVVGNLIYNAHPEPSMPNYYNMAVTGGSAYTVEWFLLEPPYDPERTAVMEMVRQLAVYQGGREQHDQLAATMLAIARRHFEMKGRPAPLSEED